MCCTLQQGGRLVRLSEVPPSPEEDFRELLIKLGYGRDSQTRSWGVFLGFDPGTPTNLISLTSSNAIPPQRPINAEGPDVLEGLVEYPSIQVRVLGKEYNESYKKAWQVASGVSNYNYWRNGFWLYLTFRQTTIPIYLGQDEKNRHIWSMDIACVRTPNFYVSPSPSPSPASLSPSPSFSRSPSKEQSPCHSVYLIASPSPSAIFSPSPSRISSPTISLSPSPE